MYPLSKAQRGVIQRTNQIGGSGGWELTKNWKLIEEINNEAQTLKRILLESKTIK
jgi:lipopolysaccharide assembly outer membrane protein LptD (OstA)